MSHTLCQILLVTYFVPHTPCHILCAKYLLSHTLCHILHVTYFVPNTPCHICCATYSMSHTLFNIFHVTYSVHLLHVTYSVLYTVSYTLCHILHVIACQHFIHCTTNRDYSVQQRRPVNTVSHMTLCRMRTHIQPGLCLDSTQVTVMGKPDLTRATLEQEKLSKQLSLNVHHVAQVTRPHLQCRIRTIPCHTLV